MNQQLIAVFGCLLLSSLLVAPSSAQTQPGELEECVSLQEMDFYSRSELEELGYGLEPDQFYFCADSAPSQFRCKCSAANVCGTKRDPWGRDLGQCQCCAAWFWAVLMILLLAVVVGLIFCMYACCCRGAWWCDGHPAPVQPILPRRGAPMVIPASMPLPTSLFRGYRVTDFDTGLPPATAASLAAQTERAERPRSGSRSGRRRRSRRRSEGAEDQPLTAGANSEDDEEDPESPAGPSEGSPGVRSPPQPSQEAQPQRTTREERDTAILDNVGVAPIPPSRDSSDSGIEFVEIGPGTRGRRPPNYQS